MRKHRTSNIEHRTSNSCPPRALIGRWTLDVGRWMLLIITLVLATAARAQTISIVITSNAAPRVQFGAQKLAEALKAINRDAAIVRSPAGAGPKIHLQQLRDASVGR